MLAGQLGDLPNRVSIEGHTDAQPYAAKDGYNNWDLSTDRANAARRVMQVSGLRENQVSQVRGYADQKLRVPANPLDPSNRRISLIVQYLTPDAPPVPAEKPGGAAPGVGVTPPAKESAGGKPDPGKPDPGKAQTLEKLGRNPLLRARPRRGNDAVGGAGSAGGTESGSEGEAGRREAGDERSASGGRGGSAVAEDSSAEDEVEGQKNARGQETGPRALQGG